MLFTHLKISARVHSPTYRVLKYGVIPKPHFKWMHVCIVPQTSVGIGSLVWLEGDRQHIFQQKYVWHDVALELMFHQRKSHGFGASS